MVEPDDPRLHLLRQPLRDGGQVWILFNTDDSQPHRSFAITQAKRRLTLDVARRRPALVWLGSSGRVARDRNPRFLRHRRPGNLAGRNPGIVLTLDGQDVRHSRALLLMPLQAGQIEWLSTPVWKQPVIETGDINGGAWQTLDTQAVPTSKDRMQVRVSSDQALSLLLVCEDSARARWRQAVENAMTPAGGTALILGRSATPPYHFVAKLGHERLRRSSLARVG